MPLVLPTSSPSLSYRSLHLRLQTVGPYYRIQCKDGRHFLRSPASLLTLPKKAHPCHGYPTNKLLYTVQAMSMGHCWGRQTASLLLP